MYEFLIDKILLLTFNVLQLIKLNLIGVINKYDVNY